ncbi:DsbA family protein [Chthonobacter albigriseus]|uniref:DsbA family protein n=1 Tax=Chthonobacter albigriseus TaxID=1683161 RepID=UPI0015EEE473|nr:DsbA family protein [Chthonobacter albigriseus]
MPSSALRAVLVAGFLSAATFLGPATSAAEISAVDKDAIEAVVRDYLVNNPEVIEEALVALQKKRQDAEAAARVAAVGEVKDKLYTSQRQVVLGDPKAPITLVEFFDYNCGYCKRALEDTLALLEDDKDVKIVLKEFPVLGPGSVEAARVAIAVNLAAPDKYLDFHKALLLGPGQADEKRAMAAVEEAGIDPAAVEARLKDPEVASTLEEVYTIANKLGLSGTPSYVLADEVIFGAVGIDDLRAKIVAVRECGKATC